MDMYSSVCGLDDYYIKNIEFECDGCKKKFNILLPLDDSIVKFSEVNGAEIRWLPTYGRNGYLDLMAKLIEGRKTNDAIDMKTSLRFQKELQKYIKPSIEGNSFVVSDLKRKCPFCNSGSVKEIYSEILKNPAAIVWLEIDRELLNIGR